MFIRLVSYLYTKSLLLAEILLIIRRCLPGSISVLIQYLHEKQLLINKIKAEYLTYLSEKKLFGLVVISRETENLGLKGIIIEAGCALGGSSILLASCKHKNRKLFLYDVFGMIPPPTIEDTEDVHKRYEQIVAGKSKGLGHNKYYGYEHNLMDVIKNNFKRFNINPEFESISFIKGLLQDTLHIKEPVAMAHIDVDWYDPVKTCLERIYPWLQSGGSIIIDDYYDWGGCRKAVDEYLSTVKGSYKTNTAYGSLIITKF